MRLAASVPGGRAGKYALSIVPSHHRSNAPRLLPTLIAATALHMEVPCTVPPKRCATVRVCLALRPDPAATAPERNRMRALFAALSALAVLAALGGCARHSASADERLRAIYTREWQWRMEQLPDDEDGTRPLADHLPKVDAATQAMRLKYWQEVLQRVDAIARERLSAPEQLNYDIYRQQLAVLITDQRFRDFEMPANS